MLEEHAGHEERHVEPLLAELRPDLAASLRDEHRHIDAKTVAVDAALTRWQEATSGEAIGHGQVAYGVLASFVGAYLQHMSREEDEAMPVLQAAMTDEQLLAVSNDLRGAIPPPRLAEFMSIMLPAMNVEERSLMFTGLKAEAPPEVLDGMCALASQVLAPSDWSAVQQRVGL
jgi:hypothetical protein